MEVIKQDDGTRHRSEAEHVRDFVRKFLLDYHFLANVRHCGQSHRHIIPRNTRVLRQELDRRLVHDIHHRSRIGKEE